MKSTKYTSQSSREATTNGTNCSSSVHHYETRSRAAQRRSSRTTIISGIDLRRVSVSCGTSLTINQASASPENRCKPERNTFSASTRSTEKQKGGGSGGHQGRRGGITHHVVPNKKMQKLKLQVLYRVNKWMKWYLPC